MEASKCASCRGLRYHPLIPPPAAQGVCYVYQIFLVVLPSPPDDITPHEKRPPGNKEAKLDEIMCIITEVR